MGRRNSGIIDTFALLPWWMNALLGVLSYGFLAVIAPQLQTDNIFWRAMLKNGPTFAVLAALIFGIATVISFFKSISNIRGSRPLIDHLMALHWGVGLLLALASYILLSMILPGVVSDSASARNLGKISQTFAPFVAALFVLAAAGSAFSRFRGMKLFSAATSQDSVRSLHWQDFESYVGEGFRREGYTVTECGGGGPDDGVDLVLQKHGRKTLVQCKQWKSRSVGVAEVRELAGVVAARSAAGGILVTSGNFTPEASVFARSANIELIGGSDLAARFDIVPTREESIQRAVPDCPRCGVKMVRRLAAKGAYKGRPFWGCAKFPKCQGKIA